MEKTTMRRNSDYASYHISGTRQTSTRININTITVYSPLLPKDFPENLLQKTRKVSASYRESRIGNITRIPITYPCIINAVPDLLSEAALVEWGKKIIEGEQQRTAQGGIPIYNPTIARVKVHYDIFLDSYERQKNLQALTNRSLEELASMRGRADELILDIWNQVETKYQDVTPNEVRLDKCRDYGLIYYYRSSEKVKEENELTC